MSAEQRQWMDKEFARSVSDGGRGAVGGYSAAAIEVARRSARYWATGPDLWR